MFLNPSIPLQSLRNREFHRIPQDFGDFDGSLVKYTVSYLSHPSRRHLNCEFRRIPRGSEEPMIVFINVQRFVILPSLPGDSATANFAEFRGNPVIFMIVFNNVLCFVILPSLPGASAIANFTEFRGDSGNLEDSL